MLPLFVSPLVVFTVAYIIGLILAFFTGHPRSGSLLEMYFTGLFFTCIGEAFFLVPYLKNPNLYYNAKMIPGPRNPFILALVFGGLLGLILPLSQ